MVELVKSCVVGRRLWLSPLLCMWVLLGLVLGLGVALRLYRLDAQPLWLDELYTAELARVGPALIWRNASFDHTLPLPNMLFWLAGWVGGITPFYLRFVSLVATIVALPLYYRACVVVVGRPTAVLATGLLAIAPLGVYYAQEARPYGLALFGIVLSHCAYEGLRRRMCRRMWFWYGLAALVAVQFHYVNLVLIAVQFVFLVVFADDRRGALLGVGGVGLLMVLVFLPFWSGFSSEISQWSRSPEQLSLFVAMQTLASADSRVAPAGVRLVAFVAMVVAITAGWMNRGAWSVLLFHLAQLGALMAVAGVIMPAMGRPTPPFDERVFLVTLPSALLCVAIGVVQFARWRVGRVVAVVLVVFLCVSSWVSLRQYFFGGFLKSPEGSLAIQVAAEMRAGDVALVDWRAYSVDVALRFYAPALPIYRQRGAGAERRLFWSQTPILRGYLPSSPAIALEQVPLGSRVWVIERAPVDQPLDGELPFGYQFDGRVARGPFTALLLRRF